MNPRAQARRPSRPWQPGRLPGPRTRRIAQLLLAVTVVAVASITLWPTPVDEGGRSTLLLTLERLHARGVPTWVDYVLVERAANVVMFLPLGALLALLLPPRRRWSAVPVLAAVSLLVELVQHVALPQRSATGWDVLANTTGAVAGVVLVATAMALLRDLTPATAARSPLRRGARAPGPGPSPRPPVQPRAGLP